MPYADWLDSIERITGNLSPLQKVLLGTDGSVTRLLELATGAPVEIRTIQQEIIPADRRCADRLDCREGEPVNHRVVDLLNSRTGEVLIHAVSDTPLSRLSPAIQDDLMRADIPIGRILLRHQIESRREITGVCVQIPDTDSGALTPEKPPEPQLSRQYRIIHRGLPLIHIEESFSCHTFLERQRVVVEAPARLHLGLIDMNGALGRVDGGIGITLREPRILLWAAESAENRVEGGDDGCRDVILRAAAATIAALRLPGGAAFRLQEWYPRHTGLGSGTQLGLAVAQALARLYGHDRSVRDLAGIVGRGGTSGIGTASFESGGFIIDGGHRFGTPGEKSGFLPSAASSGVKPAPVTVRHAFPDDWKILLVIPANIGTVSGQREQDLFRTCCPVPLTDVQAICHEVLMGLLPSLVEHDLDLFAASVNRIQQLGFKRAEIDTQSPVIRETLAMLSDSGAPAAGMSSFGPALYAIGDGDMSSVEDAARRFLDEQGGGTVIRSGGRNFGAVFRVIPAL
ncbi:MAG: chorismate pyruvate-lyase family protein [Methanoregulaceae archaeon]|nr:chorismate pyruvate-lyase family protein [Methanoregulaceae archaeon]